MRIVYRMKNQNQEPEEYRRIVDKYTKPLHTLQQVQGADVIRWLSEEIYHGKRNLKYNSVDFIIGKFLTRNDKLIDFKRYDHINLYILGTFTNEFVPVQKVADALATFYLEMKVMPNLITVSKKQFLKDTNAIISKIRNGILIYDRERNLY